MKIQIAIATAAPKFVPGPTIVRLVKARPEFRDLSARLLRIPLLPRGHFVTSLPNNDGALIKYAEQNKFTMAYGYRIGNIDNVDTVDLMLMCLDEKGRVVESEEERLKHTSYYAGIKIPAEDIKSRTYALKFERMSYVKKNLE